jgi:hypothetical protein
MSNTISEISIREEVNQIYNDDTITPAERETRLKALSDLCAGVEPPKGGSFKVSITYGYAIHLPALEGGMLCGAFDQECSSTSYRRPCCNRIPREVYEANKCFCRS